MANDEEANVEKSNNKLSIIIIALLSILIVATCTFAIFFFLGGKGNQTISKESPSTDNGTKVNSPEYSYEIEETTLNLADENQKRYIKIKLYLGYNNKKLGSELESKDHIIKDIINGTVRSKSTNDFIEKGIPSFKKETTEKINSVLTTGQIDDIYIYDILVQ